MYTAIMNTNSVRAKKMLERIAATLKAHNAYRSQGKYLTLHGLCQLAKVGAHHVGELIDANQETLCMYTVNGEPELLVALVEDQQ